MVYYIVAAQGRAFPCCCGLADGGVVDCPQELETSFVTVALVAGQWSAFNRPRAWSPSVSPPSRPQATVITEPHVRWPATIWHGCCLGSKITQTSLEISMDPLGIFPPIVYQSSRKNLKNVLVWEPWPILLRSLNQYKNLRKKKELFNSIPRLVEFFIEIYILVLKIH